MLGSGARRAARCCLLSPYAMSVSPLLARPPSAAAVTVPLRALSYSSKEPEFLVEPDDAVMDPRQILVPYIVDAKRVEIYQKHKEDPVKWSVQNIAQHYSMSMYRARAIVYLMREREQMMEASGVLSAPPVWHELFERRCADPEQPLESLAAEHGLQVAEAEAILATMEDHHYRKQNLQDYNEYMDWSLDLLQVLGVDTAFTEIGHAKVPGDNRYEESYHPRMFGDDELQQERERVRARLLAESKAVAAAEKPVLFNRYESRVGYWKQAGEQQEQEPEGPLTRWKFAFKELRTTAPGEHRPPTLVRTRRGRLRAANPVEEMNRSWNRKPRGIDALTRGQERQEAYLDPDQDEQEARELSRARRLRKEGLLREHDLLKY